MVESDDDRLAMLEDFGIDVEIAGREIVGILDNEFEDALGTMVTVPVLTVRTSDIENDNRGDTMYIDNTAYTIAEKQDDGQGITHVILQRT